MTAVALTAADAATHRDAVSSLVIHIAGGILVRDGTLLLGRRALHKRICPGLWDIVGGHVEAGESAEQALARELGEEIGVVPVEMARIAQLSLVDGTEAYELHVFRVDAWTGEPVLADDEHSELRWFTVEEAAALPDLAAGEYVGMFRRLRSVVPPPPRFAQERVPKA